jgi:hypothetical protein
MVVSAGASLLLYALGEDREVRADAGPDNKPFPDDPTRDTVLTWCAGLRTSKSPATVGASVEIRPSTKRQDGARNQEPSHLPETQVLVSCREFEGPGPWMSQEEERKFMQDAEASGRRVAWLGAEIAEPWRV